MDGVVSGDVLSSDENVENVVVLDPFVRGMHLNVPGGKAFLDADYVREGHDLTLDAGAAGMVVIPDYFLSETPPVLLIDGSTLVSADLATKRAGPMAPGQYAQLQQAEPTSALGEPIGSVTELEGSVTVTRVDGTQVTLNAGDSIFQGDALETGADGSVGLVFADDTSFSLDSDGSMVLDEMVYDPDSQSGSFEATVVKGVFSFVSGQVAKTSDDAMAINTPKATIGIRGSTGLVKAGVDGGEDKITLIPDIDGNLGELFVSNVGGFQVLNQANASTTVINTFDPPASVVFLSPQEIQQDYGKTLTTLVKTEAKKAEAKAEQTARQADEAEAEAAQKQEDAQQAEDEAAAEAQAAADAEAEAQVAEAEAALAAEAAVAAQAEAEALAAEAELAATAEAQAAAAEAQAQAEALAAEAQAAEAAAQTEAQAAADAQLAADAAAAEAQAQADEAAVAEQQAVEAAAAEAAAQQFSQMATSASQVQQEVYTQFVETGQVDPNQAPGAPAQDGPTGDPNQQPDGGPDDGGPGPDAVDAAAEEAYQEALAAGATPEEAFEAAALAASGGNLDDPAVAAARAAFEEALANGATPEEAMAAAQQAAEAFDFGQQEAGVDPNAPPDGPLDPNAPQGPDGPSGPAGSDGPDDGFAGDPGQGELPPIDPNLSAEENFDAIALAASGGNLDDPAVIAARAAFDQALADGLSPEAAMQAAMDTADGFDFGAPPPGGSTDYGMIYISPTGEAFTVTGDGTTFVVNQDGGTTSYVDGGAYSYDDPNAPHHDGPDDFYYDDGPFETVFLGPDGEEITIFAENNEVITTTFAETITAGSGGGGLSGGAGNTNFYFTWGGVSGAYTITDAGGTNQLSIDALSDVKLKVVTSSLSTSGSISLWTGYGTSEGSSTTATVSFSGINQFLLSDGPVSLFGTSNYDTVTTSSSGSSHETDILVLPSLAASETGYVIAGTSGIDSFVLNQSLDGAIVFGKGGGDTFVIETTGDLIVIGGITSTDNNDNSGSDGIPDANLNVFDYSSWNTAITAQFSGSSGEPGGDVKVTPKLSGDWNHDLWDVASFSASAAGDTLSVSSGNFNTIDAAAGDDTMTVSAGVKALTINGGADDDTVNIAGSVLEGLAITVDGGSGTADTLSLTGDLNLNATELANVSGWETLSIGTSATSTVTVALNDANIASGTLAIDASSASSGASVDATAETSANISFTGSSANDTLSVNGIRLAASAHTLTGGSTSTGDTLNIGSTSGSVTINETKTINITGFDSWTLTSNVAYSVTLHDNVIASGKTLAYDASAASSSNLDTYMDTDGLFSYIGCAGNDHILLYGTQLAGQALSLNGVGGSSDDVNIANTSTLSAAELANLTNWDSFYLQSSGATYNITLSDNNANGSSLQVYANSAHTNTTVTINGSAETTDSLTLGGAGLNDNLTGGAMVDTLNGYAGADTLTGGASGDSLTVGTGADIIVYNATTEGGDTVVDFVSGTDKVHFNSSAFNNAGTGTLAVGNFVSGAGATAVDGDDYYVFDTTSKILYYDADGSGAGSQVAIADFSTNSANVLNTDIVIF